MFYLYKFKTIIIEEIIFWQNNLKIPLVIYVKHKKLFLKTIFNHHGNFKTFYIL